MQSLELAKKNQELAKKVQQAQSQLKNLKQVQESEPSDYLAWLKSENQRLQSENQRALLENHSEQSEYLKQLQLRNQELLDQIEQLKSQLEFEQSHSQLVEAQVSVLRLENQPLKSAIRSLQAQVARGEFPDNNRECCHSDCC